jgi:hypothetical protein
VNQKIIESLKHIEIWADCIKEEATKARKQLEGLYPPAAPKRGLSQQEKEQIKNKRKTNRLRKPKKS